MIHLLRISLVIFCSLFFIECTGDKEPDAIEEEVIIEEEIVEEEVIEEETNYSFPIENDDLVLSLESIISENDFIQTSLSSTAIDVAISNLITEQVSAGALNSKIEIPYNHQKLEYVGFMHPNETNMFEAYPIASYNTSELNKELYIFKYDDIYISIESKSTKNILNVYYTLRAIDILKTRYPDLYKKLFTDTKEFFTESPAFENWVNSNKAFWIAFNNNPFYIASNNTVFLKEGNFSSNTAIGKYRNVALVNINSLYISGSIELTGSRPLYNRTKDSDNHFSYLRDGLIESIAHEMLHNYIDLAYSYDETIYNIRKYRSRYNFTKAEEISVLNTSLPYFIEHGGLNEEVIDYYYETTFDYNIDILEDANQLNTYGDIFTEDFTGTDWKKVFRLTVLD